MILDERNEFADATALSTAATGLALVGDVIDLGTDGINEVDGIELFITVDTAVTSAGSATVEFQLASDAQAAIATHAQLEDCVETVLKIEKWDRTTLQMPADLRKRQAEEINKDLDAF